MLYFRSSNAFLLRCTATRPQVRTLRAQLRKMPVVSHPTKAESKRIYPHAILFVHHPQRSMLFFLVAAKKTIYDPAKDSADNRCDPEPTKRFRQILLHTFSFSTPYVLFSCRSWCLKQWLISTLNDWRPNSHSPML